MMVITAAINLQLRRMTSKFDVKDLTFIAYAWLINNNKSVFELKK